MSEEDKPSPPSPASPSASPSSSQDSLDAASVRELARALHGIRQGQDDMRSLIASEQRKGEFRERLITTAMDRNTAAMTSLVDSVGRSLRLNREVVTEERETVERAVMRLDETGKHMLLPRESDEQVVRRVVVTRIVPWAVRRGVALKIFAAIVAGSAAVWAALKTFAQRF